MKKMRRLIPAFAMLMVAAIMLSTASFAWFTMNEQVTASGMQIQAKSTGSLIIGNEPLQYDDVKTTADLNTSVAQALKPITYSTGWKLSNGTVDPFTGLVSVVPSGEQALVGIPSNFVDTEYFVDRHIYIGSAGDALTNQSLSINLATVSGADELASKAYSVAIYVIAPGAAGWAKDSYPATTVAPDCVLHADTLKTLADDEFTRNVITLKGEKVEGATDKDGNDVYAGYTIPSIVGVEQSNTTGLKIVLRFFVDGNLDALSADGVKATKVKQTVTYTAATSAYDETKTYYLDNQGEKIANPQNLTDAQKRDMGTTGWYLRDVAETDVEYKYVNSEKVPTTGTSLSVTISCASLPEAVTEESGN